jgi:hypothetical protein
MDLPIPDAAPVIKAVLPFRDMQSASGFNLGSVFILILSILISFMKLLILISSPEKNSVTFQLYYTPGVKIRRVCKKNVKRILI